MAEPYCYPGPKRIAAALVLAGFPESALETMVAIHGAETSGNVWSVGGPNTNGTYDYGAFQINATADHPPQNWASYFENAKLAYPLYAERGYRPWYGWSRINNRFGLSKHPTWTYLDWARAGVAAYHAEKAKGYPTYRIASMYYLEEGQ